MSRTILQLFVCLLAVGKGSFFEYCTSPLKYCSEYCCGTSSFQYCCSSCYSSIFFHSECPTSVYVPVATIIGSIISVIVFIIIVSVIVAICCGCICTNRTGIQRRGRVIHANQPNVTVVTTGVPNYQPGCPQPGYGTTAYQAEVMPPPYPTNTNYGVPPQYNPGYMPEPK